MTTLPQPAPLDDSTERETVERPRGPMPEPTPDPEFDRDIRIALILGFVLLIATSIALYAEWI